MDALLLVVQVLLVLLIVVIPLFSGYDKWQSFSRPRKIIALALGLGIAVVAYGQYRRIVLLNKSGIPEAIKYAEGKGQGSWRGPRIVLDPIEYVVSLVAGTILATGAFDAARARRFTAALGYVGILAALIALSLAVKMRWWHL